MCWLCLFTGVTLHSTPLRYSLTPALVRTRLQIRLKPGQIIDLWSNQTNPKLTLHFLSLFSVFTTNPVGPVWCSRYTVAPWSSSIVLLTLSGHDRRQLLALAIFFARLATKRHTTIQKRKGESP